ncbi:MAG: hypothetical protein HY742_02945 [Deltaproteobacteria bacterium]|nr:hypothetical protein [Deltaproteobacteria bacterium]
MEKTMKVKIVLVVAFMGIFLTGAGDAAVKKTSGKIRLLVVSSYHKGYAWSKETNKGLCAALLKFGYFDDKRQVEAFTNIDAVETSKMVMNKFWMDAKRLSSEAEMETMAKGIYVIARAFNPTLIFLGDDEAARYVGGKFLDTKIPVVFWGLNNTPLKYGLVDSMEKPGHNVTGVYQTGTYAEAIFFLKKLVPGVKTFAVLSGDSAGARSHYKAIEYLDRTGALPVKLVETAATNDYGIWKKKALELQKKVDAFFVVNYAGLKDSSGNYVSLEEVAEWYLSSIKIPETGLQHQFVKQGMLCGVEDPGYDQGFEAAVIAHDLLDKGAEPATYRPRTPKRVIRMVNRQRAHMFNIKVTREFGIEEFTDTSLPPMKEANGDK